MPENLRHRTNLDTIAADRTFGDARWNWVVCPVLEVCSLSRTAIAEASDHRSTGVHIPFHIRSPATFPSMTYSPGSLGRCQRSPERQPLRCIRVGRTINRFVRKTTRLRLPVRLLLSSRSCLHRIFRFVRKQLLLQQRKGGKGHNITSIQVWRKRDRICTKDLLHPKRPQLRPVRSGK